MSVFLPYIFLSSVLMLFPLNLLFLLLSFVSFNPGTASAKCKGTTKCKEISHVIALWYSDIYLNFALTCLFFFKSCSLDFFVPSMFFSFKIIKLVSLVFTVVENAGFRWM